MSPGELQKDDCWALLFVVVFILLMPLPLNCPSQHFFLYFRSKGKHNDLSSFIASLKIPGPDVS